MINPWLKKNPLMSMWLSAANRVAGSVRGQAVAEAKRQFNAPSIAVTKKKSNLRPTASRLIKVTVKRKQDRTP